MDGKKRGGKSKFIIITPRRRSATIFGSLINGGTRCIRLVHVRDTRFLGFTWKATAAARCSAGKLSPSNTILPCMRVLHDSHEYLPYTPARLQTIFIMRSLVGIPMYRKLYPSLCSCFSTLYLVSSSTPLLSFRLVDEIKNYLSYVEFFFFFFDKNHLTFVNFWNDRFYEFSA